MFDLESLKLSRDSILSNLKTESVYDVVIVGGGVHGAATANFAARLGMKVALLEMDDFAAATSSRSSKMAHGGLRYLEMLDFQQVFEGIKAREELFEQAPHIVKPERFLIPIPKGDWFFKLKLKVGLFLYDLLVKDPKHKHRWIPNSKLTETGFGADAANLEGCFEYTDGLMNDSRLVLEHILGARLSGAICLNYIKVDQIERRSDISTLSCNDQVSKETFHLKARLVINCAGPWATKLQGKSDSENPLAVKLSRGVHVIFNKPWKGPSLFLPMPGKARYYFVWPHPGGTMIGTTERDTEVAEIDPMPTKSELDEIFGRIEKDLPASGLSRASAHYAFAGIRTLPIRNSANNSATISRKHIWRYNDGILTLVGGKYTTAVWTAWEGIVEAAKILNLAIPEAAPREIYPSRISAEQSGILVDELIRSGIGRDHARRIVPRYGTRAEEFLTNPAWREELSSQLLRGELDIAIQLEQAVTVEDVLRRRLDLEYRSGNGLKELSIVAENLGLPPNNTMSSGYEKRLHGIAQALAGSTENSNCSDVSALGRSSQRVQSST